MSAGALFKIVAFLIELAVSLTRYLQEKKIGDAAQVEQLRRQLKGARTMVERANVASAVADVLNADPRKLRDDDGFKAHGPESLPDG